LRKPVITLDPDLRRAYEAAFAALLLRFGADSSHLSEDVARTLDESLLALSESSEDGASLSPFDVLRIRAGKFAAARLPASLYRDRAQLALLRREIGRLVAQLLGPEARGSTRF
jgi:hypothetical protein